MAFNLRQASHISRGATALFFMQMFSTMSFSVLYTTLVLYATKGLNLSDVVANSIMATFVAFNFALHLLGGYVGGRLLSYRSLFTLGMLLIMAGCLIISVPNLNMLYWGMACFLAGSGFNVTCINCMLTQLYKPEDKRRESAFFWNYTGMNIGFIVGFSIAGYFQLTNNYHTLFVLSTLGNVMALLFALVNWKTLHDVETRLLDSKNRWVRNGMGVALVLGVMLALREIVERAQISSHLIMYMGCLMALVIAFLASRQHDRSARNKMWAYFVLAWGSMVFWVLYQMIPMGLTLFIERNVDRHIAGMVVPPQWFPSVDSVVIIIGGPLIARFLQNMRAKGRRVSIPMLFSTALVLIGVAMLVLRVGISFADQNGYVSAFWVVLSYVLLAIGELCISPVGYAMVGQLAPPKLRGLMMGTWLMLTGVAATLSNFFSNLALGKTQSKNPLLTNASFSHTFMILGAIAIGMGAILFCLMPWLIRMIGEAMPVAKVADKPTKSTHDVDSDSALRCGFQEA